MVHFCRKWVSVNNDEVRVIWYWCYVNNIDAPLYIYCESWKKLQKAFKFLQIQHLYQVLTPDPPWGLWGPLLSFFPPPSSFFFFLEYNVWHQQVTKQICQAQEIPVLTPLMLLQHHQVVRQNLSNPASYTPCSFTAPGGNWTELCPAH